MYAVFRRYQLTCEACAILSIVKNGNKKGKQIMLYFERVAIFRSQLYLDRSVRDTVHVVLFYITISLKRNGSVYVISFK